MNSQGKTHNLKFIYTVKSEYEIIEETVGKKNFYLENNYGVLLPRYINFDNFQEFSKNVILKKIKNEMEPVLATNLSQTLQSKWRLHSKNLFKFFFTLNQEVPSNFLIYFTKYGPGGSYDLPNKIIINLRNTLHSPFQTLVHEIIHLLIEDPFVRKYKLSQSEKESIVDWLMINTPVITAAIPSEGYQNQEPSGKLLKRVGLK